MASSGRPIEEVSDPPSLRAGRDIALRRRASSTLGAWRSDGAARWVFIWPTVLLILALSIFPLVASLTLSLTQLEFQRGRINLDWVALRNYTALFFGSERNHLLGVLRDPTPLGWGILAAGAALILRALWRTIRAGRTRPIGVLLRVATGLLLFSLLWLLVQSLVSQGGRPGTFVVTVIYVVAGITVQYVFGLGLALLAVQQLAGRRFFRIVFLLPLTITPIGVGYMFKMMTDTGKGPIEPLWTALGLREYTWVTDPWAARVAVIIADSWQWIPFVFIVLLAALEGLDQEVREAALVDGASRWQSFLHITLPAIIPVSTTIVLIRLIEGFKIVDLPNILTGGGPGTATESMTLQAYLDWRTLDLGSSAAVAYLLLIVVTLAATAYVTFVRRRAAPEVT